MRSDIIDRRFEPWLYETAMPAEANPERALLKGMEDSCAVIFCVTSNYKDDGYLATEIEDAVSENRRKGEGFAIITLSIDGATEIPCLIG